METIERSLDVINELLKLNYDRVAGFEKAAKDLEQDENGLIPVFDKLAGESRGYITQLTAISQQYGGDPADGTSTSGDLHRAWIDVKATFTGGGVLAILNECERGEDAIKAAYRDALDPDNELNVDLTQLLQKQQQGIVEGHNLIRVLRDQAENSTDHDNDADDRVNSSEMIYGNNPGGFTPQPTFEGSAGEFDRATDNVPEPESIGQDKAWQEQEKTAPDNNRLTAFFIDELKDLLWAERELVDTLPDLAEAATSQELKNAFQQHLTETEAHTGRLEQVFSILGLEPDTRKCEAMAGIIDEGDDIISATEDGTAQRDVGLIFAGQKAEHYEIASYGGMIALAKTLGYREVANLLALTLDEEKAADAKLTEIAENQANYAASTELAQ